MRVRVRVRGRDYLYGVWLRDWLSPDGQCLVRVRVTVTVTVKVTVEVGVRTRVRVKVRVRVRVRVTVTVTARVGAGVTGSLVGAAAYVVGTWLE